MLVLDYIISNEDRQYNNFGFIRDADTLEWLGFAPIYDSGTSLWYNTNHVGCEAECKPFRKSHDEQIKLVSDRSWFDNNKLNGLEDEILETLSRSELINNDRKAELVGAIKNRCGAIEKL